MVSSQHAKSLEHVMDERVAVVLLGQPHVRPSLASIQYPVKLADGGSQLCLLSLKHLDIAVGAVITGSRKWGQEPC